MSYIAFFVAFFHLGQLIFDDSSRFVGALFSQPLEPWQGHLEVGKWRFYYQITITESWEVTRFPGGKPHFEEMAHTVVDRGGICRHQLGTISTMN